MTKYNQWVGIETVVYLINEYVSCSVKKRVWTPVQNITNKKLNESNNSRALNGNSTNISEVYNLI